MRLNLQLTTTVWHAALPKGINKLVLLALCNHVNDATGLTWPSVGRLALLCGMSPRTVQTHLRALLRAGILCVRRLRTGYSTCYAVNLDGLASAFPEGELDFGPVDNLALALPQPGLTPAESAPPATDLGTPPPQIQVPTPAESAPITGINLKENIKRTTGAPALPATLMMIEGVKPEVLKDFAAVRQSKQAAPLTMTAIDTLRAEAALASLTLEQALTVCVNRGWARFEAAWLTTGRSTPAPALSIVAAPPKPAGPPPAPAKPADPAIVAAGRQRLSLIRQNPPALAGIQIGSAGPGWAHRIVNRHQAGEHVARAVLRDACTVLRLDPSSLSSTVSNPARMH